MFFWNDSIIPPPGEEVQAHILHTHQPVHIIIIGLPTHRLKCKLYSMISILSLICLFFNCNGRNDVGVFINIYFFLAFE